MSPGVNLGGGQLPGQAFPSSINAAQRAQGLGQGIGQGLGQGIGQGLNLSNAAVRGAPTPQQAAAASLLMQQQRQQQQQFGAAQQFAGGLGSLAGGWLHMSECVILLLLLGAPALTDVVKACSVLGSSSGEI
jgi:hypothetical protein